MYVCKHTAHITEYICTHGHRYTCIALHTQNVYDTLHTGVCIELYSLTYVCVCVCVYRCTCLIYIYAHMHA